MNTTKIKDLPVANQPIWFKEKRFGYGYTPASKQGWIVIIALIVFQLVNTAFFVALTPDKKIELLVISQFLFLTATFIVALITITYLTGPQLNRKKFFGKN